MEHREHRGASLLVFRSAELQPSIWHVKGHDISCPQFVTAVLKSPSSFGVRKLACGRQAWARNENAPAGVGARFPMAKNVSQERLAVKKNFYRIDKYFKNIRLQHRWKALLQAGKTRHLAIYL
jgi:hypothetical protein